MLRIGLTGGIASGKSTVAKMFAELGAGIVDTDEIARELVAPGTAGLRAVVDHFGAGVLTQEGTLDRRKLRAIVFADADERHALEAILHPRIRETALARAAACKNPYVIIVVPLLFETGFDRLVGRRLVVDCPETTQIERLVNRDGVSADQARAMLTAQLDRSRRLARADDVVDNSGGLAATRARVSRLDAEYRALAQNCPQDQGRAE